MFLWVRFAVRDLNKPASNAVLKTRLQHLPHGLKQTYHHIIAALAEDIDRKLALNLLTLMVAARRPLKLDELQYALAIATWLDSNSCKQFVFSEFQVPDFVQQLLFLCGDLISISGCTVSLVHTSAKEFLLDHPECIDPEHNIVPCWRISSTESHRLFYSICLGYLTIGQFESPFATSELSASSSPSPLFEYASQNLIFHFNRMGALSQSLVDATCHFVGTTSWLHWVEHHAAQAVIDGYTSDIEELDSFISWSEQNEHGTAISQRIQEVMERQYHERVHNFGEDDWRTESLAFLRSEDPRSMLEEAQQTPLSDCQIEGMVQLLANTGPLTTQTQLRLFWKTAVSSSSETSDGSPRAPLSRFITKCSTTSVSFESR